MNAADWTAIGTWVLAIGVIIGGFTFLIRKFLMWRKREKRTERVINIVLSVLAKIAVEQFPGLLPGVLTNLSSKQEEDNETK